MRCCELLFISKRACNLAGVWCLQIEHGLAAHASMGVTQVHISSSSGTRCASAPSKVQDLSPSTHDKQRKSTQHMLYFTTWHSASRCVMHAVCSWCWLGEVVSEVPETSHLSQHNYKQQASHNEVVGVGLEKWSQRSPRPVLEANTATNSKLHTTR
jgi:hypothetical protein